MSAGRLIRAATALVVTAVAAFAAVMLCTYIWSRPRARTVRRCRPARACHLQPARRSPHQRAPSAPDQGKDSGPYAYQEPLPWSKPVPATLELPGHSRKVNIPHIGCPDPSCDGTLTT